MRKFKVLITETLQKVVAVEASDWHEAVKRVQKEYADEKVILTGDDYFDTEFEPLNY